MIVASSQDCFVKCSRISGQKTTLFGLHLDKNQRLNMPNPIVQVIEPIVEETLLSN